MTTRQLNSRSMFLVIEALLKETSADILIQMPQFGAIFNDFQLELAKIQNAIERQLCTLTGIREQKVKERVLMAEACLAISARIRGYATATKQVTLFHVVNGTRSFLLVRGDGVVLDYCSIVHSKGVELLSELGVYGVTQEMLDLLAERMGKFRALIPQPRCAIVKRMQQTYDIAASVKRCNDLLRVMDIYVQMLRYREPTFHQLYFDSRKLVRTGSRKLPLRGVVRDSNGVCVKGVTVSIGRLKVKTKTTARGSYQFNHLRPGVYQVVFERDGFEKLTVPVAIVARQRREVDVVMEERSYELRVMNY
jgi:hypothetical protein